MRWMLCVVFAFAAFLGCGQRQDKYYSSRQTYFRSLENIYEWPNVSGIETESGDSIFYSNSPIGFLVVCRDPDSLRSFIFSGRLNSFSRLALYDLTNDQVADFYVLGRGPLAFNPELKAFAENSIPSGTPFFVTRDIVYLLADSIGVSKGVSDSFTILGVLASRYSRAYIANPSIDFLVGVTAYGAITDAIAPYPNTISTQRSAEEILKGAYYPYNELREAHVRAGWLAFAALFCLSIAFIVWRLYSNQTAQLRRLLTASSARRLEDDDAYEEGFLRHVNLDITPALQNEQEFSHLVIPEDDLPVFKGMLKRGKRSRSVEWWLTDGDNEMWPDNETFQLMITEFDSVSFSDQAPENVFVMHPSQLVHLRRWATDVSIRTSVMQDFVGTSTVSSEELSGQLFRIFIGLEKFDDDQTEDLQD